MTAKVEELRMQALALTDSERANLVAELLVSLEDPADNPDVVDRTWAAEIGRRAQAVISGQSQTEPWETVRHRIIEELAG